MFNIRPNERFAVFIDGANLYATYKSLQFELDFERLLAKLQESGQLIRAYYYTALPDSTEHSPIKRAADWLDYNGYTVVSKPIREFINSETGQRRIKGNMDMELALDMVKLADHVSHVLLFSGDGDFCRLIREVQDKGVRVTVVSSTQTHPSLIADSLRRQADNFIDLDDLREQLERPHLQQAHYDMDNDGEE